MKKLIVMYLVLSWVLIDPAFSQEKMPDSTSGTSIVDQALEIQLGNNGTDEYLETTGEMALTDSGATELSVRRIVYDPTTTDASVIEIAISANGQKKVLPLNKIRVVSAPSDNLGVSNFKALEITFDGVTRNSVVWYKILRKVKVSRNLPFSLSFVFGFLKTEHKSSAVIYSDKPLLVHSSSLKNLVDVNIATVGKKIKTSITLKQSILSVSPESFAKMSDYEVKDAVPRIQVSAASNWSQHIQWARHGYDEGLKQALPDNLNGVISEASKQPTTEAKVEKVLFWIANNMTYSKRWLGPDAGFVPRKPIDILQSKVGDCKDYAMVLLTFLKKLGIEAEPVLVGSFQDGDKTRFLREPINAKSPIPSFDYFNHIVVRYKSGGNSYIVDPGRGVSDSVRLPFFLANSWMLPLGSDQSLPFLSGTSNQKDYAGVKINTTLTRKPDGLFAAVSEVVFTGELSNLFKTLYNQGGKKTVDAFIPLMAASGHHSSFVGEATGYDSRSTDPVKLKINYVIGSYGKEGKKVDVYLKPHFLPALMERLGSNYLRFPSMDFETAEVITIKDSFVAHEENNDCLVLGDTFGIERLVKNEAGDIVITDKTWLKDWAKTAKDKQATEQAKYSGDRARSCIANSNFEVELKSRNQLSFEDKLKKVKDYVTPAENLKSHQLQMAELRRVNFYLGKDPKNIKFHIDKAGLYEDLGYLFGEEYIHAYLDASELILSEALAFTPKKAELTAKIGRLQAMKNDLSQALSSFHKSYAMDPKEFEVLCLAGRIYKMQKKYNEAAAYYLAASNVTTDVLSKKAALYKRAKILCSHLDECDSLKSILETSVAKDQDPWDLHNLGLLYSDKGNHMKAIELARKAIAVMDFGAGRSALVSHIVKEVRARFSGKRQPSSTETSTEDLLLEAYKLDSKDEGVLHSFVVFYVRKSKKDPKALQTAKQYFKELESTPGRLFVYVDAAKEIQEAEGDTTGPVKWSKDVLKIKTGTQ